MADDQFDGLPTCSKEILQEFCDRDNFSEVSDLEGFSDDEDADQTFVPPAPRIDDRPDSSDEDCEEEDPTPPAVPRPSRGRRRHIAPRPTPRNLPDRGDIQEAWSVSDLFDPLPPAPWYEPESNDLHHVSAIDNFKKYIPDYILENMARATSTNILSVIGVEMPLTLDDMKKFIGITIKISYMKLPRIKLFWAARTRMDDIANAMPRNKYFLIRSHLRLREYSDVTTEEKKNKYWKVAPLLDTIRNTCLDNPKSQMVSIDEQMVPFWGSANMRQRVKGKPNPCGLKNFVACAPDGLPLDFFLYEGKGDSILPDNELNYPGLDMAGKVIVRLSKNLSQGTSIFIDRFFTSILLLDELHLLGFQGTGTLQANRIPSDTPIYSDAEMRGGGRGYINQIVRNDGQVAIVKWFDNKPVILASSVHGAEPRDKCKRWSKGEKRYINIDRPIVVKHYNEKMGGVDMLDRVMSYYRIKGRTKKWTVRLIFHMVDFVVAAGWIYLRRVQAAEQIPKKDLIDQLDYKIELADRLLLGEVPAPRMDDITDNEDAPEEEPGPRQKKKRPTPFPQHEKRTSESKHLPELNPSSTTRHRCRLPGCSSSNARFFCTTCKVWLCITQARNCYTLFHRL